MGQTLLDAVRERVLLCDGAMGRSCSRRVSSPAVVGRLGT